MFGKMNDVVSGMKVLRCESGFNNVDIKKLQSAFSEVTCPMKLVTLREAVHMENYIRSCKENQDLNSLYYDSYYVIVHKNDEDEVKRVLGSVGYILSNAGTYEDFLKKQDEMTNGLLKNVPFHECEPMKAINALYKNSEEDEDKVLIMKTGEHWELCMVHTVPGYDADHIESVPIEYCPFCGDRFI